MGVKAKGMLRVCQGESSNFLIIGIPSISFQSKLYSQSIIVEGPLVPWKWKFVKISIIFDTGLMIALLFVTVILYPGLRVCVVQIHDDDCSGFYYHSWKNNVVIAFRTLSSFLA